MDLCRKYEPRLLSDLRGQPAVVGKLKSFAARPYGRAFIFSGGTGCGKTCAAWALARELNPGLNEHQLGLVTTELSSGCQDAESIREMVRQLHLRPMFGRATVRILNEAESTSPKARIRFNELQERYPQLAPPVVDGLFREAETVNLVSASKSGKSWMAYGLMFAVATGRPWFGRFPTAGGRVLLVDNELQKETIAYRLKAVQNALGIPNAEVDDTIEVLPLRGHLPTLDELQVELAGIAPGEFRMIVLDAKYRLNSGASEIDNAAETILYNKLDGIAERTRAAIVLIHHSSKGDQSTKEVTDVGSGAGAQSRAADCHIVLRAHQVDHHVVMESAVRNFKPSSPMTLQWEFPLWRPTQVDPKRLKGKRTSKEVKAANLNAQADQPRSLSTSTLIWPRFAATASARRSNGCSSCSHSTA